MTYRKELDDYTYTSEDTIEYSNNSLYIDRVEVMTMLDDIESRVNDIKNALEPIKGLTEIEDVKEMVESLSKDLY